MPNMILVDEIGYHQNDPKTALFRGEGEVEFAVIDAGNGSEVFRGKAGMEYDCTAAGEKHRVLRFDEVNTPGEYFIQVGEEKSVTFLIADKVYTEAMKSMLKFFYLQRCGEDIPKQYAGIYAHPACHTTKARIYNTEEFIDANGGWHDAGDYGRYIVPAAVTIADLFLALENAPELGNLNYDTPALLLDEIRYEIEWMLKLQDPKSGEVYHKVSCAGFCDFFMPEEEKEELVVSPASYTSTLDFAASLAMAVKFYEPVDPDFAKKLAEASVKAYDAALKMEAVGFHNPEGVVTGEYGDEGLEDELYWASAELYKAFGNEKYRKTFEDMAYTHISHGYGWEDVFSFGNIAYITTDREVDETLKGIIKAAIDAKADSLMYLCRSNGYGVSFNEKSFIWGSNMYLIQNASHLMEAYKLTKKQEYLNMALEHVHYIFGKNPCNVSFLTGFGKNLVKNPHHRPSAARKEAMPGMVIGGPDSGLHDPTAIKHCTGNPPAKCYVDELLSYSTNEITLYWNSAMILLLAQIEEANR